MTIEEILRAQNPWWQEPSARRAKAFPFRRLLQPEVLRRVRSVERATLILGPRQVGKTVLLLQTADDLLDGELPPQNLAYFDFSDPRLTESPQAFEVSRLVPPGLRENAPRVLLLDEISRAGRWDLWLKQAVDHSREEAEPLRIVATDSAAHLLHRGSVESGLGRWDELRLGGLSAAEHQTLASRGRYEEPSFDPQVFERYLVTGGFPRHALEALASGSLHDVHERLRADIVERAIYRDLALFDVDLEQARRLFVYLVETSGGIFVPSAYAQSVGVDRRSVGKWLGLLEQTALVARLPKLAGRATKRARSSPKIYAADHGIIAAFATGVTADAEVRGRIFEAVVFRHLRLLRSADSRLTLSYFRSKDHELDFVLQKNGEISAVEVTSARDVKPRKLERARAAAKRVGAERLIIVHGGFRNESDGATRVVPLPYFLLAIESFFEGNS